jgi:hypothetical protein
MARVDTRTLPHRFEAAFVEEVDEQITKGLEEAPEAEWLNIKEKLFAMGAATYEENVCADDLVVHEKNRGELGLNPRDFHRNLVTILKGGCNPDRLHDATSIELSPHGVHRDEQLAFNANLAKQSDGIMVTPSGRERLGTLGCGHFGQAVKATRGNCRTPEVYLQDANGRLSVSHLGAKDARYGAICTGGYRHLKLCYDVQVAWPRMPSLIQKALNMSNNVPTQTTELETAVSISEFLTIGWGASLEKAVEAVRPSSACKAYIDKIGKLVLFYVGGGKAPVVRRLHHFHMTLGGCSGGNGKWGEEITGAIADVEVEAGVATAFTRESLMTCTMTSIKVVDGVFQMFTRADVTKALNHKDRKEFEERCLVAEKLLEATEGLPHCDARLRTSLWGMLLTRWCLIATNKELHKHALERTAYTTIDNVFGTFAHGFDKFVGADCPSLMAACPWPRCNSEGEPSAPAVGPKQNATAVAMTTDMVTNPIYVAQTKGYVIGDYVMEKSSKRLYRITCIDSLGFAIHSVTPCTAATVHSTIVPAIEFFKLFLLKKGFTPQAITDMAVFEAAGIDALDNGNTSLEIYQVLVGLCEEFSNVGPMTAFIEWRENPFGMRAAKDIKKGELKLFPLTHFNKINKARTVIAEGGTCATVNGEQYVIGRPAGSISKDFDPATDMVAPFWFVQRGAPGEVQYMERFTTTRTSTCGSSITITAFQNKIALKAGDVIKLGVAALSTVRQRDGTDATPPAPKIAKVCAKGPLAPPPPKSAAAKKAAAKAAAKADALLKASIPKPPCYFGPQPKGGPKAKGQK